jgi:uncharacterized protein
VIPYYFGTSERRLFGVYEPAADVGSSRRCAAVLCYPWGSEYIYAHRALRHLATRLCASGIHTLRFDYYGTGDSGGDLSETDLDGWSGDIETAIDEVRNSTGAERVVLVGLRLGAMLSAAVAARKHNGVDALVLWDPIVSGVKYMDELGRSRGKASLPQPRAPELGGGFEVDGFPLFPEMERQIRSLDLVSMLRTFPGPVLALTCLTQTNSEIRQAIEKEKYAREVLVEQVEDIPPWIARGMDTGIVPILTLNRIVGWLEK